MTFRPNLRQKCNITTIKLIHDSARAAFALGSTLANAFSYFSVVYHLFSYKHISFIFTSCMALEPAGYSIHHIIFHLSEIGWMPCSHKS